MATVLVVSGERDARHLLGRYLERAGLAVVAAETGQQALHQAEQVQPALVLLDLAVEDMHGPDVLRALADTVPVIALTAVPATAGRIEALRAGADDAIARPYDPTEVVLRVRAVLRRRVRSARSGMPESFGGGRLLLDRSGHQVRCSGAAVVLTASEWALLAALAAAPHQVLSREELLVRIKGSVHDSGLRAVDSHIKNLRRKLGGCGTGVVQTVVGFGYRFGLDADPAPTGGDPREGDGTLPRPGGAAQGHR